MHPARPSRLPFVAALAVAAALLTTARAADTPAPPSNFFDKLETRGIKVSRGPVTSPLGSVAEINAPDGFGLIADADSIKKFYELNQSSVNGEEVGVLLDPVGVWTLFFRYESTGYVKDDEKLDAAKLMAAMTEHEDEVNAARKARGWDAMKVTGWATQPHYDEHTHNLKWAINLTSSADNFKGVFINESIRLLGRGGVMKVTLVCDTEDFKPSEAAVDKLLAASFGYVSGQKYSEWKTGDKVAAYGLGALVLGGAGVLASKAGLFAKLGAFLLAAKKLLIVAVIAVAGVFKKFWKKITGRA